MGATLESQELKIKRRKNISNTTKSFIHLIKKLFINLNKNGVFSVDIDGSGCLQVIEDGK